MTRKFAIAARFMVLATALLSGCMQDGGTELPNELVGQEFIAGKGAAEAEIQLIPVGFLPGGTQGPDTADAPVFSGKTDAQGRFAFKDVPAGQYNLVASHGSLRSFRDSLAITGKGQDLEADTLNRPAALSGTVELEPQDELQTATVQLVGTTQFVNVDERGFFRFPDLGAGQYLLRVITTLDQYTPLYARVTVAAGVDETLPQPLRPHYNGIPVVRGIQAVATRDGMIRLTWDKPRAFTKVFAYLIYRDSSGSLDLSTTAVASVKDTAWNDTIYTRAPKPRQYEYTDTISHAFLYRVRILDISAEKGPSFGFTEATSIPPTLSVASGKWKRLTDQLPFIDPDVTVLAMRDSLWMMGPPDSGFPPPAFPDRKWMVSADGIVWKERPRITRVPVYVSDAIVWRDSLWIIGARTTEDSLTDTTATGNSGGSGNSIWNSADGSTWHEVIRSVPGGYRWGFQFTVFKDSLRLLGGSAYNGVTQLDPLVSGDGRLWVQPSGAPEFGGSGSVVVPFQDRLWSIGGWHPGIDAPLWREMRFSADGYAWESVPAPSGMLPRARHGAAAHAGKLWVIGGDPGNGSGNYQSTSDVWSSADGLEWSLIDGRAPFGPRSNPKLFSFKGKLWVMGVSTGGRPDLWFMDP